MKTLDLIEARSISGGKTVYCPICGKKSSVWFFQSVAKAQNELMAMHYKLSGYDRSARVHGR